MKREIFRSPSKLSNKSHLESYYYLQQVHYIKSGVGAVSTLTKEQTNKQENNNNHAYSESPDCSSAEPSLVVQPLLKTCASQCHQKNQHLWHPHSMNPRVLSTPIPGLHDLPMTSLRNIGIYINIYVSLYQESFFR